MHSSELFESIEKELETETAKTSKVYLIDFV